jgi:integrase
MAGLLYGSGLRLTECLRLRVKDIDFGYRQVTVRDGKGEKDWRTVLPRFRPGRVRGFDDWGQRLSGRGRGGIDMLKGRSALQIIDCSRLIK